MSTSLHFLRRATFLTIGAFVSSLPVVGQTTPATPPAAPAAEAPVVAYAPKAPASASLRETFRGKFVVGAALNPGQFTGANAQGAALVAREFNSITAENAMKWDALEPQDGQFRFDQADQFVEFGQKNNMFIVGHNLCWHSQLPGWVSQPEPGQAELTKEVLLARLKRHVMTVAGRYKGKIKGWDVVNEAINDGEGDYRQTVFFRVIGKEYLALAFKWAHEADPDAELYYNDYNLDANDKKRATAIELVKYLREQGAVVHGIGMQGHYNLNTPTTAKIDETIGMFEALGLKVHITELDVTVNRNVNAAVTGAVGAQADGPNPARAAGQPAAVAPGAPGVPAVAGGGRGRGGPTVPLTEAQQQALAKRYGEIFEVFLKHKSIARVTFWGLRDTDSWRRQNSPLLFDEAYGRKPAYDAVIAAAAKTGK